MKKLRSFFMEDWLEANRFEAKFNLGESGGRPRTVREILLGSGLTEDAATQTFLKTPLYDSPNTGRSDLRELVAKLHPGATKENVLITTGTSEALFLLFRHLKPKSVALAMPAFQLLYELPIALDAKIIPLPVRFAENGQPFIDETEWYQLIKSKKPECLVINNPHNPSGLILSEEFLQNIIELAKQIGCTVVGDEHYRFLSSETSTLGTTVYTPNESTFVTGSYIKCLGTPGLRIGWCVGSSKALAAMQNEKNYTTHTVNPISEWISVEVLKNLESTLWQTAKKEWIENRKNLTQFLKNSSKLYGFAPQGGLVSSIGFTNAQTLEESDKLMQKLLEHKIFVLPLASMEFGQFEFQQKSEYSDTKLAKINKGFGFRLGLGCEPAHFLRALETMEEVL